MMRHRSIPLMGVHALSRYLLLLAACVTLASAATRSGQNPARVPMSSLKTLYFKDGTQTFARRGKKLPQLQCIGNSKHLCNTYGPDIIMCKSAGDGAWRCEADLHPSVRLGSVEVSCEGWDHPDDEYVLRGSCLLEYNILPAYADGNASSYLGNSSETSIGSTFFFIAFFAVVGYIIYSFFRSLGISTPRPGARPRTGGGWGGFGGWGPGGGGGGGHDAAPPPYQPYPKPSDASGAGWRPGFWTGLGMGGLAAQAARSMFDSSPRQQRQPMGANWGAARRRTFLDDEDDEPIFRQTAGSSRAGPSETRRSMGFGGTRNR